MSDREVFHSSHHGQHLTLWEDGGKWSWADGHGCNEGGYATERDAINAYVDSECRRHQSALQCAADARIALEASSD